MVEKQIKLIGPKFQSAAHQAFFDANGYVKIPLLNKAEITDLRNFYQTVRLQHEAIEIPFITTSHSNNAELIEKVNNGILNIVSKPILKAIDNAEIIFSNFLVKRNGENTQSNPHQDLTIVDESKYLSFSVWIPLEDTSPQNGAMRFLPKSHFFDISIRPNSSSYWKYNKVMKEIIADMQDGNANAGEALVFSHSLIHGSYANFSDHHRLACVISLQPKEAEMYNYFIETERAGYIQKYKMTKEAFIKYIKGGPPSFGELQEEQLFHPREIDAEEYLQQKKKVGLQ